MTGQVLQSSTRSDLNGGGKANHPGLAPAASDAQQATV